tara:strand:+ start:321 stop:872 length:552 start_codon:yes stop_codon:yes gene_type:complete
VRKALIYFSFQILAFSAMSQVDLGPKGVYFEIDYSSNMIWLVTNFESPDCMDLAFAHKGADSALPIVCKSYVDEALVIYLIDIPLIELEGEGEILQLCPRKRNFETIFEYEFRNGRFIVKSRAREMPKEFDFKKIKSRIAKLNKQGDDSKLETEKKSAALDWIIASVTTVFVGGLWALLLFAP